MTPWIHFWWGVHGALGPQRTWALSSHNLFSILFGVRGKRWEGEHRETRRRKSEANTGKHIHHTPSSTALIQSKMQGCINPTSTNSPIPDMLCIWTKEKRGYSQTLTSGVLRVEPVLELCLCGWSLSLPPAIPLFHYEGSSEIPLGRNSDSHLIGYS